MARTQNRSTEEIVESTQERIRILVGRMNELLGYDASDYRNPQVTFGYIGDVSGSAGTPAFRDTRAWSVFLPHPGRVGTDADCIGHVATDDVEGWLDLNRQVAAIVKFLRWQKGAAR